MLSDFTIIVGPKSCAALLLVETPFTPHIPLKSVVHPTCLSIRSSDSEHNVLICWLAAHVSRHNLVALHLQISLPLQSQQSAFQEKRFMTLSCREQDQVQTPSQGWLLPKAQALRDRSRLICLSDRAVPPADDTA